MSPPPNHVYSAFSFIGFVLMVIPFYWHLEGTRAVIMRLEYTYLRLCGVAWNTGTCLFMFWTGLGCLFQFINSIVWNKNIIDRAPIYCDIGKFHDALFSSVHSLSVISQ